MEQGLIDKDIKIKELSEGLDKIQKLEKKINEYEIRVQTLYAHAEQNKLLKKEIQGYLNGHAEWRTDNKELKDRNIGWTDLDECYALPKEIESLKKKNTKCMSRIRVLNEENKSLKKENEEKEDFMGEIMAQNDELKGDLKFERERVKLLENC